MLGEESSILKLIVDLKNNGFNLRIKHELINYLNCRIIKNEKKDKISIIQPHLTIQCIDTFGEEGQDKRLFKTLGTSRFKIVCPNDEME